MQYKVLYNGKDIKKKLFKDKNVILIIILEKVPVIDADEFLGLNFKAKLTVSAGVQEICSAGEEHEAGALQNQRTRRVKELFASNNR